MSPRSALVSAIAAALLSSPAYPQSLVQALPAPGRAAQPLHRDLRIQATLDQEVRVYGHLRLAKGCGQGPIPEMTIVKPPSVGMLTVRVEPVTLTQPDFGSCSAGHSGMGKVVYYQSTSAGNDAFEYQMSSPGLPTTTWSVSVEIH